MALPTDAEVVRYRQDGAICLRSAFPMDWIERLREAVDADMAAPGPMVRLNTPEGAPGLFFVDCQLWQRHAAARAFVYDSPAKEIAARLMSSHEVIYYHDHLLVKEPGTRERTPWHHDQPYYPIDGAQVVSLWLPLDPVDRATCVEYVKGSHRWGRWFQPKFFRQGASIWKSRIRDSSRCPISMPSATATSSSPGIWCRATSSPSMR